MSKRCNKMPTFVCRDIGMDCDFKASAATEAELMGKIAEHAKSAHKIEKISPDLLAKVKRAIKM
jgi:predicted small metal-binding protein